MPYSHTSPRFLVPELGGEDDVVVLPPGESHHLALVLRLGPGDRVGVFDGNGREFIAEVVRADRTASRVRLIRPAESAPEPHVPFSLVQAVLKGTAMDDVVRDATMLGARDIEPVITSHVAVKESVIGKPAMVERWRRVALASAKQCRRAVLPVVHPARSFAEWLATRDERLRLMFVEPSADWEVRALRSFLGHPAPASAALIVGPEGGWSRSEIESAVAAGCVPVSLGRLTMRADAMTVAAASLFRFVWDA
jgi:16S rRNA (uracil1498-N3)-methyltransferase